MPLIDTPGQTGRKSAKFSVHAAWPRLAVFDPMTSGRRFLSDSGRSRLDALRSQPVGGESASTVDPVKLVAYRNAFDHLSADEQHACLARLRRGQTYEQIALDLGAASAAQARGTVTRAMDRLLAGRLRGQRASE